jgi:hypothetical protein
MSRLLFTYSIIYRDDHYFIEYSQGSFPTQPIHKLTANLRTHQDPRYFYMGNTLLDMTRCIEPKLECWTDVCMKIPNLQCQHVHESQPFTESTLTLTSQIVNDTEIPGTSLSDALAFLYDKIMQLENEMNMLRMQINSPQ